MKSEIQELKNAQLAHEHAIEEADQSHLEISRRVENLEHENRYLENENYDLKENFRTHSMKYNIIFGGIPCRDDEDTEAVLKSFLKEELDIQEADDIPFQNGHRL